MDFLLRANQEIDYVEWNEMEGVSIDRINYLIR